MIQSVAFLDELQKRRMIDDVKDELLALEIPETNEQEETVQENDELPAKKGSSFQASWRFVLRTEANSITF